MRLTLATVAALALAGCYESALPPSDAGPYDGGPCAPVGGLEVCTEACGDHWACDDGYICNDVVCVPFGAQCNGGTSIDAVGRFCHTGTTACLRDPRIPTPVAGTCVDDSTCDELSTLGLECYWSDASEYGASPPPATECPPNVASTPLCGGACGDCQADALDPFQYLHCVGRSDERDLGVCTVYQGGCSPEVPATTRGGLYPFEGWTATTTVCLVWRTETGELAPWGYPVPDTGCRTYRGLFPADVECMDDTWTPLAP